MTDPRTVVVRVENYPYHLDLTFSQRHYCSGISSLLWHKSTQRLWSRIFIVLFQR